MSRANSHVVNPPLPDEEDKEDIKSLETMLQSATISNDNEDEKIPEKIPDNINCNAILVYIADLQKTVHRLETKLESKLSSVAPRSSKKSKHGVDFPKETKEVLDKHVATFLSLKKSLPKTVREFYKISWSDVFHHDTLFKDEVKTRTEAIMSSNTSRRKPNALDLAKKIGDRMWDFIRDTQKDADPTSVHAVGYVFSALKELATAPAPAASPAPAHTLEKEDNNPDVDI